MVLNNIIQTVTPRVESENTHPIKIIKSNQTIHDSYADYLIDESKYSGGEADELVFAYSEDQIVQVIHQSFQSHIPVTISAGRTGIVGGAVPLGGTLLSLEGMNRILGARWDEKENCWFIQFQPGISLKKIQEMLDTKDVILKNHSTSFAEESNKWFYPPDPTEKSAHLGGTVATNASGARSLKYGQTRKYINSLRVVLSDGSVISLNRKEHIISSKEKWIIQNRLSKIEIPVPQYPWPLVKNTVGYYASDPMNIIDLFIGSEGTLGIITEIEIALRKKADFIFGGIGFFPSEETALQFVQLTKSMASISDQPIDPTAIEYFDDFSLQLLRKKSKLEGSNSKIPPFPDHAHAAIYFEQEGKCTEIEKIYNAYQKILTKCHSSIDETWGGFDQDEQDLMAEFRHSVPEMVNMIIGQRQKKIPNLHKISTDIVVPDNALNKMIQIYRHHMDKSGFEYVIFGHIGENHLHVNILPQDEEEFKKAKDLIIQFSQNAVSMGGTVSGEHGIGKIKKPYFQIMYSREIIQKMQNIKKSLDARDILGRGTLFDEF